jgi:hypothetical protein
MSKKDNKYKVVEQDKGSLKFELINPLGITVAVFKTKERAESSAKVCNLNYGSQPGGDNDRVQNT